MRMVYIWTRIYHVTTVESGYEALSILSKRNHSVDIILTGLHLRDLDTFELLQHTVNMDLPTILISTNDGDTVLAAKAIENGAILFLVHPITTETLQYLRQYVMREKLMTLKNEKHKLKGKRFVEEGNRILDNYSVNKCGANMFMGKGKSQVNEECNPKNNNNFVVKRKASIEWTEELQAKFWEATNYLGEGRCYPKEILEHMNVSGLTRLQVASFLQRCRKRSNPPSSSASSLKDGRNRRVNTSKFGSMPLLIGKSFSNVQSSIQETQENHRATTVTPSLDGNEYVQNFSGLQQFNQNQRTVVDNEKLLQNERKGKEKVEYSGKGKAKATTDADFVFFPTPSPRVPTSEILRSYTPPAGTLEHEASSSGLGLQTPGMRSLCSQTSPGSIPSKGPRKKAGPNAKY